MKGFDVWYHKGTIDFAKVKKAGYDFILPRDGWGTEIDPKLVEYATQAMANGVAVPGVFHFIYATDLSSVIQNAEKAIENVKKANLPKSTVIWCDMEEDSIIWARNKGTSLTIDDVNKMVRAFCNHVLAEGYRTGIYLDRYYLEDIYGTEILDEYDVWLVDINNSLNYPCVYKQYSWHGWVDGCSEELDLDEYVGQYAAGTAKEANMKYTEAQLVDVLITLAKGGSDYRNQYPFNLLYWDGRRWSADCNNLYKALFNGRSIVNPRTGSYQSDLSLTGDVDEWGLMKQCTDRSTDFSKLDNHFRCLYMEGHFGGYLGKEINIDGQGIINCVEATPAWEDGIQYSYVDSKGNRYWAKGRTDLARGTWTHHGLATKWIDYGTTPVSKDLTHDAFVEFFPMIQKGSNGEYVKLLQKCLQYIGFYAGAIDGSFGSITDTACKAYQKSVGLYQDGICGVRTWGTIIK